MAFLLRCRLRLTALPGGMSPDQLNDFEYVNADGSGDPR